METMTFAEAAGAARQEFDACELLVGTTYRVAFPTEHVARRVEFKRDGSFELTDNPWGS